MQSSVSSVGQGENWAKDGPRDPGVVDVRVEVADRRGREDVWFQASWALCPCGRKS